MLRIGRKLNEHWDAHIEVRHNGPTRSGEINPSDGLGIATGVSYRF